GRDRYRRRVLLLKRRLLCQNCVRTIERESGLSGRIALARGPRCSYSFRFDHIAPDSPRVGRELKILRPFQTTPAHSRALQHIRVHGFLITYRMLAPTDTDPTVN